jgi:hypothetical protein
MSVRNVLAAAGLVLLSSCYKNDLVGLSDGGGPGTEVRKYNHTLLLGLIPLSEIDLKAACGDKGVWAVSTRLNALSLVANAFTFGLYTPTVAKITCKG